MLTKAGFPNGPASWDEVVAAAKKIKEAGGAGFGLQGKAIETDVYWYYALWSYGGDLVGSDGKAAFASPAGVKALTLYKSMIDQGLTQQGPTNYTREDVQNLFKQGRVGMMITAPFLINQIAKEAPNLQYGIAPVPKGTAPATYAVTDSIVMFKDSKVKKSAWKFLEFLFTKDPRVEFTKTEGFLPTTKAEAADPYFANNDRLKIFVDLLPEARFAPIISGWEDVAKDVIDALQSVYLGNAQPEPALKQAAAKADQALGKCSRGERHRAGRPALASAGAEPDRGGVDHPLPVRRDRPPRAVRGVALRPGARLRGLAELRDGAGRPDLPRRAHPHAHLDRRGGGRHGGDRAAGGADPQPRFPRPRARAHAGDAALGGVACRWRRSSGCGRSTPISAWSTPCCATPG